MTRFRTCECFSFVPGERLGRRGLQKLSFSKAICVVLLFCAAAVVVSPAQTLYTLASFDTNGTYPAASLIQATDGNFYGTTSGGGNGENCQAYYGGCGTVFEITPSGRLTTLYSFCTQTGCTDGCAPLGRLVQGTDGNLYGTTSSGGDDPYCGSGDGTVFKITPSGMLTTMYIFCHQMLPCRDGAQPYAGLVQGTDGYFYGTTAWGGNNPHCVVYCGTVFRINAGGALTPLHSFGGPDGKVPLAGLMQGTDGYLYGTTSEGGDITSAPCSFYYDGCGTVFKINPVSPYTLTSLHIFCAQNNCTDGETPYAGLVQGSDGNIYGTTGRGGANGENCQAYYGACGTVFEINPISPYTLTTLHSFYGTLGSDGGSPQAGLVQATDGNFYGTTFYGGASNRGTVFRLSVAPPTPAQLVLITPCRVVDTRESANGAFGGPPIQGGTYRSFPIPQSACNIPANAAAYSLNVTVVPHGALGYLTIWPTGESRELVSTMNSDGRVKANAAIVQAGLNAAVSVYASNTTDLVLDIDGYFAAPSAQTLEFYPLTPCRVLDTRSPNGPLGGPYLQANQERDFPVLSSNCQIPSYAQAYSMNFAVVPVHGPLGDLIVWQQGIPRPLVSTLNNPNATIVTNAAIVNAGTGGGIAVYPNDDTQLVGDINGYFAIPAVASQVGLSLYPLTPCRVIDTRNGNGAFSGELTVNVGGSICAPPGTAQAYVFNATVVPRGFLGELVLLPEPENLPPFPIPTLDSTDGSITSNMAIVPNLDGSTKAYAIPGRTQLILDISNYFAQ